MILVAVATGTLGGRIVRKLLAQGKAVCILVREPSPSVEMASMGLAMSVASSPRKRLCAGRGSRRAIGSTDMY
jgi:nucleoside-diphosphate-sugar epimerase